MPRKNTLPLTDVIEGQIKYLPCDEPLDNNSFVRFEGVLSKILYLYRGNAYVLYFSNAIPLEKLTTLKPYLFDLQGNMIGELNIAMIYDESKIYKFHKTLLKK